MRPMLYLLLISLLSFPLSGQAPGGFNFQALARDAADNPIASQGVGVRVNIRQGGAAGAVTYSERHEVTTSDLGVFDLQVGQGTTLSGDFSAIDWGADSYFLQIDLDPAGGTAYTDMGATQLLSVPYALYAATSGDADADKQSLSLSGTVLSIENGNTVDLSVLQDGVTDADADPTNELQRLGFRGTDLSITGGNTVDLSALQDGVEDADADPTNEIQSLALSGNQLQLSGGGGAVDLSAFASPWTTNSANSAIYYTGGPVGVSTNDPESDMELHVGGDVLVQSNLGGLHIGYPNNGNRFRLSTFNSGADLLFRTKPGGSSTYTTRFGMTQDGKFGVNTGQPDDRLTIFQDGQAVGAGMALDDGINDPWHLTHGFGLRFHYGNNLRSFINATTGAYVQSSDERLKKDVSALGRVSERLLALRPTSYSYRGAKSADRTIGLLAQSAREQFPELVYYSPADDVYGINYAGFSVVAIKAFQEQQEVIEAQDAELTELRQRLERLEARLEALEH